MTSLSPALGEFLLKKASEIGRQVEGHYLPLWLKQRGIDPSELS